VTTLTIVCLTRNKKQILDPFGL